MIGVVQECGNDALARARALASPLIVWVVWGAMTVATILFIRQYSRNIPYVDDFSLVRMMVGNEPFTLRWLWSQHNEHRPLVSRLIMAGLHRFIVRDFRVGQYFNAGLLSATAASMIVLARRLRGHTSLLDVALPLSILNIGQSQTLLIGFAMNLVLTSGISCALIWLASIPKSSLGWPMTLKLGVYLVLLPLCGGGGLIMLPPLLVWLVYDSIWGCMREGDIAKARVARSIGLALVFFSLFIASFYMVGYKPPPRPLPTSFAAVAATVLGYFSLVVCPNIFDYWHFAGWIVVFLVAATLSRLVWVAWRQPDARHRALAIIAIILAMLCAAVAVGITRSFQGPAGGRASRYITTTAPLFCALYVAWIVFGSSRARRLVPAVLLALTVVAIPANFRYSREYGKGLRAIYTRVERGMKSRSSISAVVKTAWPALNSNQKVIDRSFRMLKQARVGLFGNLVEDNLAEAPDARQAIR
jgi:hypothetical protein